jgi:hypothetical protein
MIGGSKPRQKAARQKAGKEYPMAKRHKGRKGGRKSAKR